ncbi:PREDICTED: aprataxin [Nicrophorus vespilloides]|uniref:Aprataxin n=1 Tax=Nicrophorus vespilloides TaxID=110193 RepID=A0ABM1ME45_NICVS|nr:PREDICTED: aprataxin [Nicrophorus vespilloides]
MKRKLDSQKEDAKKSKSSGHWANGLLTAMEDPDNIVKQDDKIVVIKDKYPKAEFHYLVIPKEEISTLKSVDADHLVLLRYMHKVGEELAEQHKHRTFKFGYHAEASMFRLHLHVISDDMNSPCLKTKKHWNSYTSGFFLDSEEVCNSLEEDGVVKKLSADECKAFLNEPLKCHKCDHIPKHMPSLKQHLLKHLEDTDK